MRREDNWSRRMDEKVDDYLVNSAINASISHINEVITYNVNAKWLISKLAKKGIIFKVYNLGGGVKRITTEVDRCPCCGKLVN